MNPFAVIQFGSSPSSPGTCSRYALSLRFQTSRNGAGGRPRSQSARPMGRTTWLLCLLSTYTRLLAWLALDLGGSAGFACGGDRFPSGGVGAGAEGGALGRVHILTISELKVRLGGQR